MFCEHLFSSHRQNAGRSRDEYAVGRGRSRSVPENRSAARRRRAMVNVGRTGDVRRRKTSPEGSSSRPLLSLHFPSSFQLGLTDIKACDYLDWVLKHPGQVVLTVSQVVYTREVNQTFDLPTNEIDQALIEIREQMVSTIKNVCSLVFAQVENSKLLTVEALLTLQVHWRDIYEMLIRDHVSPTATKRFVSSRSSNRFATKTISNGKNICVTIGTTRKVISKFFKPTRVFPTATSISAVRVDWSSRR